MKNNTRVYIVFGFLTLLLAVGFYIWYNNYREGRNKSRINIFGSISGTTPATPAEKADLNTPVDKLIQGAAAKFNINIPRINI
jgi:hypothetical protein